MTLTKFYRMMCDTCGEWQVLPASTKGRKCHMTPQCKGVLTKGDWFNVEQLQLPNTGKVTDDRQGS